MKNVLTPIAAILCFTLFGTNPATSQEQAAELRDAFETHKLSTRSIGFKKHRGLTLVTGTERTEEVEFTPVREPDQVSLRLGFEFDSAAISPEEVAKLDTLCSVMVDMSDTRFRIIGHADAEGDENYNVRLSLFRAIAVQDELYKCGVPLERLEAIGVGERYPIVSSKTRNAENRRVEFQALKD